MSFNSSELYEEFFSYNFSFYSIFGHCLDSKASRYAAFALGIGLILLLPFSITVVYLGCQRWRKQRSSSTATSHSDHFTYHSIGMQLNKPLGISLLFIGNYFFLPVLMGIGIGALTLNSFGQALFHLLTCVERYLAVVHPITYLKLRQGGGVRVRNISIGCVWFLSCGYLTVYYCASPLFNLILFYCMSSSFTIILCFCSLSVLYVLKRPGPGGGGGNQERVDQSKQRAFYTIMAITGALLLRMGGTVFCNMLYNSSVIAESCLMSLSILWFEMPSNLVLPLLFLHRAGKLQCSKSHTESG